MSFQPAASLSFRVTPHGAIVHSSRTFQIVKPIIILRCMPPLGGKLDGFSQPVVIRYQQTGKPDSAVPNKSSSAKEMWQPVKRRTSSKLLTADRDNCRT